jgi:hypothetical protein
MYSVMKAMRETIPTPTKFITNYYSNASYEWYNGTGQYADALVANQNASGCWINWMPWAESTEGYATSLTTAMGVLILQGGTGAAVVVKYTLTVTVLDANTLSPIDGATVAIVGPQTLSGLTNPAGQLAFNGIQAGGYTVTTSASGYVTNVTSITLTSNYNLIVKLVPVPVVRYVLGVMVDDDTAVQHIPIVSATVSITGPSGTLSNATKAGGLTEFDRILGGGYIVTTSMPGYITNTTSITLNSNYNLTVSLLRAPVVGGISIATGIGILVSYIGLVSTLAVAAVATAVCVRRVKRRK